MLAPLVSSRSGGVRLEDLVAVPIDVGKHSAMASVVDFTGAVLVRPFEFGLDRRGVEVLTGRVREAVPVSVSLVRVGLEAAGHYHLPLAGGALPLVPGPPPSPGARTRPTDRATRRSHDQREPAGTTRRR